MKTQKSHDSINEGPSLTTEGPPLTNVVHVPMSHLGQNLSLISNHILVNYLVALHSYTNLHAFEGTRWWLLNDIGFVLHNQACGTPRFIIVTITTSYNNSMYSTSRSCLHSFLCNPYILFKILIYLSPLPFFCCFQQEC